MSYQFEWDSTKDKENRSKHKITFSLAIQAFYDEFCIITNDPAHSVEEHRYFCYGKINFHGLYAHGVLRYAAYGAQSTRFRRVL